MRLIKLNPGRCLAIPDILVEGTVRVVGLLLDSGAELQQLVWDRLIGSLQHIDQSAI